LPTLTRTATTDQASPEPFLLASPGSQAGAGELSTVVEPTFKPAPRDWQYLTVVQEILAADGRVSDDAIANRLPAVHPDGTKRSKQAVAKQRSRPGFVDWLNAEIRRATDDLWPKAVHRAAVLATRGSIDHFNALARLRGEFKQPDGGPVSVNTALVIEVREAGGDRHPDGSRVAALRVVDEQ
jgi:hypothetical protein